MTGSISNYTPVELQRRFREQAFYVWVAISTVVLVWAALILTAPLFLANGLANLSTPLYTFFSFICHQMPERSLHIDGHPMAVCSRCSGVYFGLLAGVLVYPLWRQIDEVVPIPRFWLFLSLIPVAIDWSLTAFGVWENTHFSRFLTGSILGIACATFIVPAVVEITRNLSDRRRD